MTVAKSGDQALQLAYDPGTDSFKTTGGGAPLPAVTTVIRETDTGSGAVAFTTAFAKKMRIHSVSGHADAAVVEALTITLDSLTGAAFDALLNEIPAAWTDFDLEFEGGKLLEAGDELVIACANSGGATYGIEVIAEEVA